MRIKTICLICFMMFSSLPLFSTNWYVRPAGGNYGAENGTSYLNAWDGLTRVVWGPSGVKPGDTLWVCGLHSRTLDGSEPWLGGQITPPSGSSNTARVTIRGDYPGNPGIIWGGGQVDWGTWNADQNGVWYIELTADFNDTWFRNVTANGFTVLTPVASLAACRSTPDSVYASAYEDPNNLYVHCSDGLTPDGRIWADYYGYNFNVDGKSYITFLNFKHYASGRYINFTGVATYIRWEGLVLSYGSPLWIPDNCNYLEFINNNISWSGNGIYAVSNTNNFATHITISGNTIHDLYGDPDAHAIGFQGGDYITIEDNYCYNCGNTILLYAFANQTFKNTVVRRNFVKDSHTQYGTSGWGISTQCDNNSLSDKSGNKFYQNIVVNCTAGFRLQWEGEQEVYNNIVSNCETGIESSRNYNRIGPNLKLRNNIFYNSSSYHIWWGTGASTFTINSDNNLFYPTTGIRFRYAGTDQSLSQWSSNSKPGCVFDPNPTIANPLFVGPANENFHLQSSSAAIDRGVDVGLTQDREGTSVPQGSAPDIGAYEYISGSNPLLATLTASPTSGYTPLAVSFSGSATGGTSPYAYRWSFGDGGSSTVQNPSHTYSSSGSFTVTLTVTDSQSATNSKSLTIAATTAPSQLVANMSASPSSGQAPLTVNFTGSATGGTSPYSYRWTFGDSQSSTTQNPSHTYSSAGAYTANLTVTDSTNATNSKSLTINVASTPSQLIATVSADPTSGLAPLNVNFTGSASGGTPPYSYSWNFGDGSSSSAQNLSHTYSTIGNYTANLTVTDSGSAIASATVDIAVGSVTAASLSLAAVTGAPAPGQGGTTDPSPGNHSFSIGSTASVRSIPNTEYRFSKWTGDITEASIFNQATTLTMDTNKSLSATFCTKCADVNGDLKITPADAQRAFDIYLGRIANPTWCELENADVKCDGAKFAPKVTPADAQTIFHRYLRKGVATSDCSGNSRVGALATQSLGFSNVSITISNVTFAPRQDVVIPIIVESPSDIKAFGLDLSYPSDILTYIGLESTELTNDFDQLEANVLAYQGINQERPKTEPEKGFIFGFDPVFASKILTLQAINSSRLSQEFDPPSTGTGNYRLLRVGGYKTGSTANPTSGVLVTLVFRVIGELKDPGSISVIATYDDIRNASIKNEIRSPGSSEFSKEYEKPVRQSDRKFIGKRYDF